MDGKAIFLREDRDGAEAKFIGSAEDTDGDLTAIRGHKFSEGFLGHGHNDSFLERLRGSRKGKTTEHSGSLTFFPA